MLLPALSSELSGFDAVLTLPASGEAPKPGLPATAEYCVALALVGMPRRVARRAGFAKKDLPLGLQIVAPFGGLSDASGGEMDRE